MEVDIRKSSLRRAYATAQFEGNDAAAMNVVLCSRGRLSVAGGRR
jgi:hypothetical protein